MAIELKEVQDFLSEELKVMKKDFSAVREADQKTFDEKVKSAMDKLQVEVVAKAQEISQKEIDKALVDINEKMQKSIEQPKTKSFGWSLHETLKENLVELHKMATAGTLAGKAIKMKDFNYSDFTGYEPFATDFRSPILQKYESFHYRNIMPAGSTTKEFVKYPKETTQVGSAAVWAYGTGGGGANESKPELEPKLITQQDDVQWLAAIIKGIPISMLEDLDFMTSFLQNKGRNDLMQAEDFHIQDILLDSANSEAYNGSYTTVVDKFIDAAFRQLKDNLHNPNGIVTSNTNYVDILLNKAGTSEEYSLPSVTVVNPQTGLLQLVGVPVYANSYLAAGDGIVGDWNQVQLITRQAPRLRFFDQNSDDATKNVLMMRIEERIAVSVFYDNAMIIVSPSS